MEMNTSSKMICLVKYPAVAKATDQLDLLILDVQNHLHACQHGFTAQPNGFTESNAFNPITTLYVSLTATETVGRCSFLTYYRLWNTSQIRVVYSTTQRHVSNTENFFLSFHFCNKPPGLTCAGDEISARIPLGGAVARHKYVVGPTRQQVQ